MHCLIGERQESTQLVEEMVNVLVGMANDEEAPTTCNSQGI